jgi:S1-C subfamily serine protease
MRFVLLLVLSTYFGAIVFSQETVELDLGRIREATVFIIQAEGENLTTRCVSSGTIVRPDGVILTNAHSTVQSFNCPGDTIIIALTIDPNQPPIPKYRAEIVQQDIGLDLALLRITREFDGRLIDPTTFPALPFVDLANSEDVQLDDTVTFVGFGDIGDTPVKTVRGTIRGFLAEPSGGEKSWMKTTSAEPIPGTMTGGGVYNEAGELIGIPTSAPLAIDALGAQCLQLQDTNRDGTVNEEDSCVPIGDPISVLRPSQFARPLIRSASLGLQVETLTSSRFQSAPIDRPVIRRVFSSPAVVDGVPSTVVSSLPAGTNSQYLFFDYVNMTPETVYEVRVSVDGIPNQTLSLPPVRWSGGESGIWYIGSSGQPYPNGNYEFRIFVDGIAAATYNLAIGGSPTTNPSFSNVVFGVIVERQTQTQAQPDATLPPVEDLTGSGYVLPKGPIANARFIYTNMRPDSTWTVIWYYNGAELIRTTDVWSLQRGENGSESINLEPAGGLPTGTYRLELYIDSALAATGDFVVAGENDEVLPNVFSEIVFLRAEGLGAPTGQPSTSFPDGVDTLYARFDWQAITPGTRWRIQWLVDETVFYEQLGPWANPEQGRSFTFRLTAPGGIPDGTYTLRLYVDRILLRTADVSVGIGQLRIDRFAEASGIQLRGRIIDADTRQGIAGVTFVLIGADFSVADFVWREDQVYALATTDRNGNFQIDRPLDLDVPYSVLVIADGYLPLTADGFAIQPEDGNPIDMLIPLTRD